MTEYTYDVRGNLVRVDLPNGDVIEYLVDGSDRRVGKKKNGVLEKIWIYRDQLRIAAELDGSGNLLSRFVYGAKSNVPDLMVSGGVSYRIHSDHLGSPRAIVDATTGAVVWRADYDAWGRRTVAIGAADFVPFGFAGGVFDPETGLTRFGARDYDSAAGRWTAKEPNHFRGGVNVFGYSWNDPINFFDPDGRHPVAWICRFLIQRLITYVVIGENILNTGDLPPEPMEPGGLCPPPPPPPPPDRPPPPEPNCSGCDEPPPICGQYG